MSVKLNGELVPTGGGDPIPLIRPLLTIGRRESCDVCMRFPNISGLHAELSFRDGFWHIRDLNSTNGIKVNGLRVAERTLQPRDEVTIGLRTYVIEYEIPEGQSALAEVQEDIMSQSLMEKAGLERRRQPEEPRRPASDRLTLDDEDE
jgi:pSer/pThr/pTyr-binding forkhead associated (FHA) protein